MTEQELYKLYRVIREELRDLYDNIRPEASVYSQEGIYDSGYEQALDESVEILDKHFTELNSKYYGQVRRNKIWKIALQKVVLILVLGLNPQGLVLNPQGLVLNPQGLVLNPQ